MSKDRRHKKKNKKNNERNDEASYEETIARAEKLSEEEERMKLARKVLVAAV